MNKILWVFAGLGLLIAKIQLNSGEDAFLFSVIGIVAFIGAILTDRKLRELI